MDQSSDALQNGAGLKFLSAADAGRAARTWRKLARHDIGRWVLTGGFAIEHRAPSPAIRALHDIDFMAADFGSIPATLAADFLFRHVHPLDPPAKTMLQFVDPDTAVRVDVFRAYGATLQRATTEPEFGSVLCVSTADLLAREARLLLDLAFGRAVPSKHAADYLRLLEAANHEEMEAVWADHRKPAHPAQFHQVRSLLDQLLAARRELLIVPEYSRNTEEVCLRCHPVDGFPPADAREILALLGYC